jgi:Ni,Fe-hydrogenase III small subunit/formate hydrogenlyase subunit 6/NADH:ubiquinone oxidoreductase subunit I
MLKILAERWRQGHRTSDFPKQPPVLSDRFLGMPVIDASKCLANTNGCHACAEACPTDAIAMETGKLPAIDLGRCLFCTDCTNACPPAAIHCASDYRLSANTREALRLSGGPELLAHALEGKLLKLFGRSLKLRQVSAGGCNACEADINVLGTLVFDLGRFGIQVVASPRHADGLIVTGPVSENMRIALKKTYDACTPPRIVIAVGACAISGGPFADHPEVHNGADSVVPVDLYIPGCPPHPYTILDGLLRLLGRLEGAATSQTPATSPTSPTSH